MQELTVRIKPSLIIWTIAIVSTLFLALALKDVIVIFFLAFIVSAGFRPLVDKMSEMGIARTLGLIIIYLIATLIIVLILLLTIETFISQFNTVNANLPNITENILESLQSITPQEWGILSDDQISEAVKAVKESTFVNAENLDDIFEFLGNNLQSVSDTGLNIFKGVTNVLFSGFLVFMLAAYLIARPEKAYRGLIVYIPRKSQEKVMDLFDKVEKQLGEWLVGQLILMLVVGLLTYVAVMIPYIFGVEGYELHKFALLIALIAVILEAFPNIGPTITLFITLLMGIGTGGSFAVLLYILIVFLGIQQLEAILIVPLVMKKAVNLDPIIVILAISAGFTLGNVIGAVLSIPIIVILRIILDEINENRIKGENEKEKKLQKIDATELSKKDKSGFRKAVDELFRKLF